MSVDLVSPNTILVVEDDRTVRNTMVFALELDGYLVLQAGDGLEALEIITQTPPDLILLDVMMPRMNGHELLQRLRAHSETNKIPIILLTARTTSDDVVEGLELGADDYLSKPVDLKVLQARIRTRLKRSVSKPQVEQGDYVRAGIYEQQTFLGELERELSRVRDTHEPGYVASIVLHELPRLLDLLGNNILEVISKQMQAQMLLAHQPLEILTQDDNSHFLLLMPEMSLHESKSRLTDLSQQISEHDFLINNERMRFTPVIGFTPLDKMLSVEQVLKHMRYALEDAQNQIDLDPKLYLSSRRSRLQVSLSNLRQWGRSLPTYLKFTYLRQHGRLVFQIGLTFVIGIGIPLMMYLLLGTIGVDIIQAVYIGVVIALLLTALLIWAEGYLALRAEEELGQVKQYPLCSAIIAAYLPNEADTLMSTIDAFLHVDYPGPIQVILAYNTPHDMEIEATFKAIAKRDIRFVPIRFEHSTSKAQNVNAALQHVTGEFVGVFDADHQPQPDAFTRAWNWLSQGYDVVQGHCLIRNGATNWVTRLISVEFEAIYAVAHPGRASMHGYGIFGGSNGYWRTELLKSIRMHGFMLTEDIDSSMRITKQGHRIKVDPQLVSKELAPTSISALWNQRMRWAQGWFQVSIKHALDLLTSPDLTRQQKFGVWHLIVWREIYPWISMQIIPIVLYWVIRNGGFHNIDWFVPIFVVTTIVTLGTGPAQIYYIYKLSHPTIQKSKSWYLLYVVLSFFYTEFKNTIARAAQIKELMRERQWKTTPRE